MTSQLKKNSYTIIALLILAGYLLPYIIFWENSHIQVYDNLDQNVAKYTILADSGLIFGPLNSVVPNYLNGIPRNLMGPELDFRLFLSFLLPPYFAYIVNMIFMHFIAFFGMHLLLKNHFMKEKKLLFIVGGVSLCFALLPFWPSGGLSVAGVPLVLYAFLNIRSGNIKLWSWLILLFVPMYSSFIYVYIFFLFLMFIFWIYDFIKTKRSNYVFLISIIFMVIVYLIVEYRLIYEMFFNQSFVSHRTEWSLRHYNIRDTLNISIGNFIFGQNHVHSLQQYFINISVLISIIAMVIRKRIDKIQIFLLSLTFIISLWYGFFRWRGMLVIKDKIDLFNSFNLSRFHWLHPTIWYLIFFLALVFIIKNLKLGKYIVIFLLLFQMSFLFYSNSEFVERRNNGPSYKQFYSVELFEEIKEVIGEKQNDYRVASIGFHPSIAIYNGFFTIDGFHANYPLEYKHEFRKVIEKELEKNEEIQRYFDDQADRCYVMVSEIGRNFMIDKSMNIELNDLELNNAALKDLNCKYILSSVLINNSEASGLELIKVFENDCSVWRVHLYRVY